VILIARIVSIAPHKTLQRDMAQAAVLTGQVNNLEDAVIALRFQRGPQEAYPPDWRQDDTGEVSADWLAWAKSKGYVEPDRSNKGKHCPAEAGLAALHSDDDARRAVRGAQRPRRR
jgi:hypothetical protein